MPKKCYVCNIYQMKGNERSFHKFPKNLFLRKKWFSALGIPYSQSISVYTYICADHFENSSFQRMPSGKRFLKDNAVPTIAISNVETETIEHDTPLDAPSTSVPRVNILQNITIHQEHNMDEVSTMKNVPEVTDISKILSSSTETASESLEHSSATETASEIFDHSSATETASESLAHSSTTETASESLELLDRSNDPKQSEPSFETASASKCASKSLRARKFNPRKAFFGDISSQVMPVQDKKSWKIVSETILKQRKKIRCLQQSRRRLKSRLSSLNSLMTFLREKRYISENSETTIQASVPAKIMEKMLKGSSRAKYNPELRSFALTLHFYSPKAYNFVRAEFNKALPHPSTITKWYQTVDGSPGFTQESLFTLKIKSEEAKNKNHKLLCNLVLDEMSIRKRIEWTGSKFTGYVDLGTNIDSDCLPEAKEALVFMLVSVNAHWKIPIGYFLLDGLCGSERANLVKMCLSLIHPTGIIITSITFDGAAANISMTNTLGANISDAENMVPFFLHPITNDKVFIFLDPCHMIKLVRNCLGSQKIIQYKEDKIEWRYLENLVNLQEHEGLHAANKLKRRHLEWAQEKMKVKIAAQTLSRSVSDALFYVSEELHIKEFQGVRETANFIRIMNDLFDILNSRNMFSKYIFKRPLSPATKNIFFSFFEEAILYIKTLELHGTPIIKSPRKTGFLGLILGAKSLQGIYNTYLECETPLLKYILSYKFSQDHLEIFFSVMRSRGGYNNNPTARQFESTYKKLLIHAQIKGADSANAVALDATSILNCSSRNTLIGNEDNEEVFDVPTLDIDLHKEHSYASLPEWHLTDFVADIVEYIAGFVVKSLKSKITCIKCLQIMEGESSTSSLQVRKKYGNLINASNIVTEICQQGEKHFRHISKTTSIFSKNIKNVKFLLVNTTIKNLPTWIFETFKDHIFDEEPLENHSFGLVRLILMKYFDIRIHYECNKKDNKLRIRHKLTKTILFKNQ